MMLRTIAFSLMAGSAALAGDRALVIGIDDYALVEGASPPNGARADAERMRALLTGPLGYPEEGVTLLTDGAASYDAILTHLIDDLVGGTGPGDRVFLYFAGLGTSLADGAPALVAHDGATVLGRIPVGTLTDILGVIPDREITVVLDTGFDGGSPGVRGIAGAVPRGPDAFGDGLTLWTAAEPGQFAWDDAGGGVFTEAWEAAVRSRSADADGDGTLTQGEIFGHVSAALAAWCDGSPACTAAGRGLAPAFTGDAGAAVLTHAAPVRTEAPIAPLIADDGAPAGFRETLGFVTDLFAPSNAAGLTLAIEGGLPLRVGQFVSFRVSADRPGTLLLLDVDPDGRLAQVYPSNLTADGGTRLTPGRPLTIPNALGASGKPLRIRVTEPSGQGLLLGLFIEGELPQLDALMPAGLSGGPLPNAGQSLFEISQGLLRLEADPERPVAWSATYLPYRIEP